MTNVGSINAISVIFYLVLMRNGITIKRCQKVTGLYITWKKLVMRVPTNSLWQSHDFDNAFNHIRIIISELMVCRMNLIFILNIKNR
jgi:hypothetical protein